MSTLFLDARFRSARLAAAVRLSPTARLQRKSTVCGLSGLRPCFAGSPSIIHLTINRTINPGTLVPNPPLRNTESGTQVASATIANNDFYNDGEGERQQVTTFEDGTVWGKPAENFSKLAKKGQEIVIEGRLRRNDWESEDGQKHSKHFVRAETWQFTQYKKD